MGRLLTAHNVKIPAHYWQLYFRGSTSAAEAENSNNKISIIIIILIVIIGWEMMQYCCGQHWPLFTFSSDATD